MNISTTLILFSAELFLLLIGLTIFLLFYIRKLKNTPAEPIQEDTKETVDLSNTYIDYLDQEILRQDELSFTETFPEEKQDNREKMLDIRSKFISIEKSAAELTENENKFWDTIYSGIQEIHKEFATVIEEPAPEGDNAVTQNMTDEERILYIESQGKNVDGEFNKLKDIISGQEHSLNDLMKALKNAEQNLTDGTDIANSDEFKELIKHAEELERKINDSKMCMEVLEMENDRLQSEVDDLQSRNSAPSNSQDEVITEHAPEAEALQESNENIDQIKDTLSQQEQQISELNNTLDKLELSEKETEILQEKLDKLAKNSKEMMGCITVLEDENEYLSNMLREKEAKGNTEKTKENENDINSLEQVQEVTSQQEQKIAELMSTIDELQLSAEQTEKLKSSIQHLTRSSQEMMTCITILEEENDGLQKTISDMGENSQSDSSAEADGASSEEMANLKSKIKQLGKDIIKKDVAYAKLQDELSTIEKEYQAMYEEMQTRN